MTAARDAAPADDRRITWPGVVVVGAGATGLLVAERLRHHAVPVLLVERQGLAAGQTGHCHGYLHRGYIYRRLTAAQRDALNRAADWWTRSLAGTDAVMATRSVVAFTDEAERDRTRRAWDRFGMPYEKAPPHGLARTVAAYSVPETTISPQRAMPVTTRLAASTPALSGRAVRLRQAEGHLTAVEVLTAHGTVTVDGTAFVIAAGLGTPALLGSRTQTLGARTRLSYMLVCWSRQDLPPAFCLPADRTQGLFVASRPCDTERAYLISTFVSFWPSLEDGDARRSWLRAASRVLAEYLPDLWNDREARWGLYAARKIEVSGGRGNGVPEGGAFTLGWDNAVAVLPGKLVLAPLYATECLRLLSKTIGLSPPTRLEPAARPATNAAAAGPGAPGRPTEDWAAEDWTMVPRFTRSELFDDSTPLPYSGVPHPLTEEKTLWSV